MNKKDKLDMFFYYIVIYFFTSFVGYLFEVLYYLMDDKILVNRGLLYGPILPVYGTGCVLLVLLIKRFKKCPIVIFFLSMLIAGVIEYFAGLQVMALYHERWWDYRNEFLNINGYVCLRSLLLFGIGGLVLFYIAEPLISKKIMTIDRKLKIKIVLLLITLYFIDNIFTFTFRHPL